MTPALYNFDNFKWTLHLRHPFSNKQIRFRIVQTYYLLFSATKSRELYLVYVRTYALIHIHANSVKQK